MIKDEALAGYQSGPKHSLIGKPLEIMTPADDLLHPPAASGHYSASETFYSGFSIPERLINGEIYIWFHPVLRMVSASIYIWTGLKGSTLMADYVHHHHYLPWPEDDPSEHNIEALGLRVRVVKPLEVIQISFHDHQRGVSLECLQTAIMPPAGRPGGYHFTQAMKVEGELILYGERMAINGYFSRDRSWGQERRENPMNMPPLTWMVGIVDEQFAFHVLAHDDPALNPEWKSSFPSVQGGENLFWGYIWKDGELTPVTAAQKRTIREPDGLTPRSIEMNVDDAKGRTFDITGQVQARMPWQTWQNMNVFFCQTRWEIDGRVGYGDSQDVQFGEFTRSFGKL